MGRGKFDFILFLLFQNRFIFETLLNNTKLESELGSSTNFSRIPITISLVTSSLKGLKSDQEAEENLCLTFFFLKILNFFDKSVRVKKQKIRGKIMYNFSFSVCSLVGFFYYSLLTHILLEANSGLKENIKFNKYYEFDGKKIFSLTLHNFTDIFNLPLFIKGQFDGFLKINFSISKDSNFVFFFDLKI